NGATLENVSITGNHGGVLILDGTRLHDITLKDVVITTPQTGAVPGVLIQNADRIAMDGVSIDSYVVAIDMINVTDSLVMNSTIVRSTTTGGLSVLGGSGN